MQFHQTDKKRWRIVSSLDGDILDGMAHENHRLIYAATRKIPPGRVATYGQVAEMADLPGNARQVGYALSCLPEDSDVPWHRVVNAKGEISQRAFSFGCEELQRELLEQEGVTSMANGRISLRNYRYKP